jgi:hypothetical protein
VDSIRVNEEMPNRLRELAQGRPIWSSWISVWHDDVSGNKTKQWNVHNNTCVTHANLPRETLQSEYHIRFVGTSQHASCVEQAFAVQEMIQYVILCSCRVSEIECCPCSGLPILCRSPSLTWSHANRHAFASMKLTALPTLLWPAS